jgi:hypothetical protein
MGGRETAMLSMRIEMFYFRFFLCLGFGLFGITLVLKVVMESLFNDWDPMTDVRRQLRILNHKRHHAILEAEKTERLSTRLQDFTHR